ncbi:MAG: hypothetical protein ACK4GQ_03165 [Candidatus Hadarchaeales archaeon]
MVELSELNWIVEKASEMLSDKVKDGPLSDKDLEVAFELFAKPRLTTIESSFSSDLERAQARDYIMMKLQDRMKQLNSEHWRK